MCNSSSLLDNPITVAEKFIMRHGLGSKRFFNNDLVSHIAQQIREHCLEAGDDFKKNEEDHHSNEDEIYRPSMQILFVC